MVAEYTDHALAAALDSSHAFEGPEKLLEVWFFPEPTAQDLRAVPLELWAGVLDLVSCKILSVKKLPAVDAYLLSELSLFVFAHKLILKTCGTTTTLACLGRLFAEAQKAGLPGPDRVHGVFYSRRQFMFPSRQRHVHTLWLLEVKLLNDFFSDGRLYVVGNFSADHWHLYVGGAAHTPWAQDQTLEILMTQLDERKAAQFSQGRVVCGHGDGQAVMARVGLDAVFETPGQLPLPKLDTMDDDFAHDAFAFAPCGFSSNSVSGAGYYYTLHVTPEPGWLYASFETNYPFASGASVSEVLARVLGIFQPGRFQVTLVSAGPELDTAAELAECHRPLRKLGYEKLERASYDLKLDHTLLYLNFAKS